LDNINISKSCHNIRWFRNLSVLNTDQNFHEFSQKNHEIEITNQIKIIRNHNQILGINSKWKEALMALIPLLEITEIRKFRITSENVSLSNHASPITSGVHKALMLYLLHHKPSRIALLEIDHSQDRAYPSVSQSRCHDLFLFSHGDRSFSLPSWRNRVVFLFDDVSLSLFKCLKYYFLFFSVSSKDTQYININRDEII
jgi:hypothetical protein